MGIVFLLGGLVGGGAFIYLNYISVDGSSLLDQKEQTLKLINKEIDESLFKVYKETYPNISDENIKNLLKEDVNKNYIRNSINISISPKGK